MKTTRIIYLFMLVSLFYATTAYSQFEPPLMWDEFIDNTQTTSTNSDILNIDGREGYDITVSAFDDIGGAAGFYWICASTGSGTIYYQYADAENIDISLLWDEYYASDIVHIVSIYYSASANESAGGYVMESHDFDVSPGTTVVNGDFKIAGSQLSSHVYELPCLGTPNADSKMCHIDGDGFGHFAVCYDVINGNSDEVINVRMGDIDGSVEWPSMPYACTELVPSSTEELAYQADIAINSITSEIFWPQLYVIYTDRSNSEVVYEVFSGNNINTNAGSTCSWDIYMDKPGANGMTFDHPAIACTDNYYLNGFPTGPANSTAIAYEAHASHVSAIWVHTYDTEGTNPVGSQDVTDFSGYSITKLNDVTYNTFPDITYRKDYEHIAVTWVIDENGLYSTTNFHQGQYPIVIYTDEYAQPDFAAYRFSDVYLGLYSLTWSWGTGVAGAVSLNCKQEDRTHYTYYDTGDNSLWYKTMGKDDAPLREGKVVHVSPLVYPNPFTNEVNVALQEKIERLSLYNSSGELITTINQPGSDKLITLKDGMSKLAPGIYLMKIDCDSGEIKSLHIVKQ
jgi:hypothetical protein